MTNLLDDLAAAVAAVRSAWHGRDVESLTPAQLMAANEAIGRSRRLLDAAHVRIASEIARQSRPELGADGLAKVQGYRNAQSLIAATTGTSSGEANRLMKVGEATAPRMQFSGEQAPARRPHVAEGLAAGRITAAAAAMIIAMLDKVALRASPDAVEIAERALVDKAAGLALEQLSKVILRAEAWLDPDGIEPRENDLRADASLHIREERSGMLVFTVRADPARGAPIKAAIEGIVTAELRAQRDAPGAPGGEDVADSADTSDAPRRTIPQMQLDALVRLAEHALGCAHTDLPLDGATVIVRVTLDDLQQCTGSATIDGVSAPVSIATVRRMAAGGGIIPWVMGADSEILDWGRTKRLFTPTQKLALVERDGGCAMCGAPPGHTKAHHLRWWARDAGPTDLDNGVLLCESCHHRIHDNGWEIRIDGTGTDATVLFIPPAHVDPARIPRLGGRARFGFAS